MNTITISLSEPAQRAALLAGQPAAKTQCYEVRAELLPRLLALPWTKISPEGTAFCIVPAYLNTSYEDLRAPDGTPPSLPTGGTAFFIEAATRPDDDAGAIAYAESILPSATAALDVKRAAYRDDLAKRAAEQRAIVEEWAAMPLDRRMEGFIPEGAEHWAPRACAETRDARQARRDAADRMLEREKAEAIAAKARRIDAIARWVGKHGTESQRERLAAGMLPDEEIIEAMREDAFSPIASFPIFVDDRPLPPCHRSGDCEGKVEHIVDEVKTLDEDAWQRWRQVRRELGMEYRMVPRLHQAICQNRGCQEPHDRTCRLSALITLERDGFTFTREISLESAP